MVKKRYILVCLALIVLACHWIVGTANAAPTTPAPVTNSATQSGQGYDLLSDLSIIFPKERIQKAKSHGYDVKFSKYKPSRYYLEYVPESAGLTDITMQLSNKGNAILHGFNNLFWQALLMWDFTVITVLENSFSLDIVSWFADAVEKAVQQLAGFTGAGFGQSGLWGNFLMLLIICGGAYIAYMGMIQKKTTDAISAMVKSLLILMLAMVFFANAGGVMRYLNDLSSGLSQELMGIGLDLNSTINHEMKYPDEVASFAVADKIYNMLIYQPYLMLQYGKTKEDNSLTKERIEALLNAKVGSNARNQVVAKETDNAMMKDVGIHQRFSMLILLGFSHLILGFMFFIIAGAILVYQFLFVIFALYAPFALLMALYPAWSGVAMNWMKKFVGYQVTKLILGVFLSVLVTMSQFLYGMSPPDKAGYIWTIAMQLILVIGIIWRRKDLFSILSSPVNVSADGNIRALVKKLDGYLGNTAQRIQKFTSRS
ncbi:TrbL/VirB6 plasmid conjugal transfer protein [Seinonella peptonophila]|uniref:TrbL/VirB6 plasmid conjugal transfer protein n=1 Tax=Seinonella peptonophila TaxID=112248 RepID=A0A1M4WLN6_9BACL|nr:type IV secretion system protein [Seinonella peptonophila]SHE82114.1 TrbL/VirB6 plasmid conjugal transfer protein [Seinonella peptonophila]